MNSTLRLYQKFARFPFGKGLFSRAVCFRAPYFASIGPLIENLKPGECVVSIKHRRKVTNHLGTVHAIALCNMAELAAGLCIDVSLPKELRWIPKGMTVNYLKKATGKMRATARLNPLPEICAESYENIMPVEVINDAGETVFNAHITMWISLRKE